MKRKIICYVLSAVMLMSSVIFVQPAFAEERTPAFPGAEGGGMYSKGARAADSMSVYHVTNLNDSGAGSFRDAVSQGNRIVVFDVAGTVMLESNLKCRASNITILGQTAPGEGICIGGASVQFSEGSNIIIRYMRFRSGDYSGSQEDGVGIRKCTNVILDHCSISWSVDECLSAYENKNFTAQYCIISESLNQSIHGKGAHGYGGIWGGINASFHHNLISTHNSRNPRIGTSATVHSYNDTPDYESLVDIRNNVFYNWGSNSGYGGENNVRVNFVNNYYKPGLRSKVQRIYEHYFGNNNEGTTLHLSGNVMEGNETVTSDNWLGVSTYNDAKIVWTKCENISDGYTDSKGVLWANDEYIYDYPVTTQTAEEAYNVVLDNVGASYVRDDTDKRIIDDVKNNTVPTGSKSGSGLIDSQKDVGGWTALYGTKEADTDNDGIPDDWEDSKGLDKNKASDSLQISANGYTYIEEYANYLAAEPVFELDKTKLKSAIIKAQALDRTHYGSDTDFTALDNAVEQGIALLSSRTAAQKQLDECEARILSALNTFAEDDGWKLIEAISEAEKINKWDYTADSYKVLEGAIANADTVLKSQYTRESVELAINEISAAKAGLEKSLRRNLKSTLRKCRGVSDTGYYTSCWNELQAEILSAEKLYKDFYIDESTYRNSIDRLNNAYGNLKGNFKEILKVNETFENGTTGIVKSNYSCEVSLLKDMYDNEGGFCSIVKRYPADFGASLDIKIPSDVDAISLGSSVIVSEDVCFAASGLNDAVLLSLYLYDADSDKTRAPNRVTIGLRNGSFYAFADKQYDSNIKTEADKWYNLSIFLNNENRTVSFCVDGQPVVRNVSIPGDWGSDFYNNFNMLLLGKHSSVLIDNLSVIERIYDKKNCLYGDADYNGKLTSADAAHILQKVLNSSFIMPVEDNVADYMGLVDADLDGILTAADAAMVLQKVLTNNYVMPIEASTIITTITTTTESTTEPTTTDPKDETTLVLKNEIDFEDTNGSLRSPYIKDIFTIENSNGKIDVADVDIFGYKKAIILDGNTITIDVPENMELEIIAGTTDNRDAWLNTSDGMIIISTGDDKSCFVTVSEGRYTISGNNAYIAALKLYDVVYINRTTSTTETTTEITTEATTELTTNSAVEFDFSALEKGTYTTDFTDNIFSLIAGGGSYEIKGDDERYIRLNSLEYSPNASEGYVLIDAVNIENGFTLNLEAALDGYGYGQITLSDENGEVVDITEVYTSSSKTKVTLNAPKGGKYTVKVTSGIPVKIYKLQLMKKNKT